MKEGKNSNVVLHLFEEVKRLTLLQRVALLLITLYSLFSFSYGIYGALQSSGDQQSFYYTTKLLIERQDPYKLGSDFIRNVPPSVCYFNYKGINDAGGYGLYPPSAHILFLPFSGFAISPKAAKVSWFLWNLVFLAIIFFVISIKYLSHMPYLNAYILLCLIIGSSSTKTNLSLGQTTLFSFAAFLLTLLLQNKHKWMSALAFSLAVSKPSLMILFAFYLFFKKEYKILLIAFSVHIMLTIVVSAWIGMSPVILMRNYFEKVSLSFAHPGSLLVLQTAGISIKSILHFIDIPQIIKSSIVGVVYFVTIIYIYIKRNHEQLPMIGLIALLTLFVDYHHHYDFSILLIQFPMFMALWKNCAKPHWSIFYYLFLMYMPNISRMNLLGFETGQIFSNNLGYLFVWQIFYTALFVFLLVIYIKEFIRESKNYSIHLTTTA